MTSKKNNLCTLILGAIFVNSNHIQQFCEGFQNSTDFTRILRDFAQTFTKL